MDFGKMNFSFMLKTDMRYGPGEVRKLPEHVEKLGWKNIALIVDHGPASNPVWKEVRAALEKQFSIAVYLEPTVVEPTYDYLDEVKPQFMSKTIDGFIVLGGGSVLDLGKALSLLITNPGPAIQYRGFDLPKNPGPGLIAVPTTAGTGSEITPNAVFTDAKERRKLGINTALYLPKLCILDPLLTASCPRGAKISSGMDALVHAHESFVSKKANPITKVLAMEAIRLVFNSLEKSIKEPNDLDAHGRVQLGSFLAAAALFNSSAGPTGAMSYPLGVHYNVPHGMAGAVFLPWITQHNVKHGYTGYAELYPLLEGAKSCKDPAEASRLYSQALWGLCERLQIPKTLAPFGFKRDSIPAFVAQAPMLKGAFEMNPIPFTADDLQSTLEAMSPA